MSNEPTLVAKVGHVNGGHIAVLLWSSGHIGIGDATRLTQADHVLNSEQANTLGEALIAASRRSRPVSATS